MRKRTEMATHAKTAELWKLMYLGEQGWIISIDHGFDFPTAQDGRYYMNKYLSIEQRKLYKLVKFTTTRKLA
jgi:hypothetical protein